MLRERGACAELGRGAYGVTGRSSPQAAALGWDVDVAPTGGASPGPCASAGRWGLVAQLPAPLGGCSPPRHDGPFAAPCATTDRSPHRAPPRTVRRTVRHHGVRRTVRHHGVRRTARHHGPAAARRATTGG